MDELEKRARRLVSDDMKELHDRIEAAKSDPVAQEEIMKSFYDFQSKVELDQFRPKMCILCGKMNENCSLVFIGNFRGFACPECISQVNDRQQRRFTVSGEMTEPSE